MKDAREMSAGDRCTHLGTTWRRRLKALRYASIRNKRSNNSPLGARHEWLEMQEKSPKFRIDNQLAAASP
jgi:hypothetical protein